MIYVSISYNYSPEFSTPESWIKRTEGYGGILEGLAKNNTVISVKQINYKGEYIHKGVKYCFVDFHPKKTYFPRQFHRFIKSLKPDVVFIQGLHRPVQLIHLKMQLGGRVKVIAHHHAEQPFTGLKKYVQRLADRYIDAYLFASKAMGMEWVQKGNISSGEKIYEVMEVSSNFYPLNKQDARLKTGVKDGDVFLWVGRLNANKDPLNVVRAFLKFAENSPGACLYMIYHTDELLGDINEGLEKKPFKNAVTLVGHVPHDDLLYWYNSADFFISGSHYEGSGTALCEAMSCGCVPVVTDILSFRMITDNGNCGLLYEVGNEAALLSALVQIQTLDVEEKRQLCIQYFRQKLSFDAIAEKIQQITAGL